MFYLRIQRSSEGELQQFSTKDIYHLIDVLNEIQYGEKRLDDISLEDQNNLNYLMDILEIGYDGFQSSLPTKEGDVASEAGDNQNVPSYKDAVTFTMLPL